MKRIGLLFLMMLCGFNSATAALTRQDKMFLQCTGVLSLLAVNAVSYDKARKKLFPKLQRAAQEKKEETTVECINGVPQERPVYIPKVPTLRMILKEMSRDRSCVRISCGILGSMLFVHFLPTAKRYKSTRNFSGVGATSPRPANTYQNPQQNIFDQRLPDDNRSNFWSRFDEQPARDHRCWFCNRTTFLLYRGLHCQENHQFCFDCNLATRHRTCLACEQAPVPSEQPVQEAALQVTLDDVKKECTDGECMICTNEIKVDEKLWVCQHSAQHMWHVRCPGFFHDYDKTACPLCRNQGFTKKTVVASRS